MTLFRPRVHPTRRDVLRSASVAATVVASSGVLAACAGQSAAGSSATSNPALPGPAKGSIILNFAPNWQGASWNKTALQLNQDFIDANYNAKNPGVYVKVNAPVQGGAAAQITASIAGSGYLDVFQDCCVDLATLQTSGYLTPLNSYLKQDNVDQSIWNQRHLQVLTYGGQIMALPAYDGPVTVFYRQDILDQLGLEYPDSSWTYQEAQAIWQAASKTITKGGKATRQYGVQLFNTGYDEMLDWWLEGWGTTKMNADGTQFTGNNPKGVACLTFLQDLATGQIAQGRSDVGPLASGQCVFKQAGGWELLPAAQQLGNKVKWNILPNPIWPAGRSTFNNIDYYVLNKATKYPQQAWELLKWVCAEPDYQSFQMQATLVQPCLNSLWDQWQTIALQAAPPLHGKDLKWISDAATGGYAWPNRYFEYSPVQAGNVMIQWGGEIWSGQVSAALGVQQMADQINALEAAGVTTQAAAQGMASKFPTNGPTLAAVTPGL